jgi:hypothetical protein
MSAAPNFKREPWKHPAVWPDHLVRQTRDCPANIAVSVATCECGWCACVKVDSKGPGHIALDDAIVAHWHSVIAEAEAVPA